MWVMGQTQTGSMAEAAPARLGLMQGKLHRYASELKQIAQLSYEQFLQSLQQLNNLTSSFCDINGKKLVFLMKKDTDTTFLWKGTVRIRCLKVNSRTGNIESSRILHLKQYVQLYNEITEQASLASLEKTDVPTDFCASVLLSELESHTDDEESECCICMDRKAEVILSCSHIYCEQCIDEWNVNHKTCPICRAKVESSDETWVLTEKPDSSEMAYETTGYLMGLADRTGSPTHSPE